MSYQVLARKWRPQDFSSLIGQEAIVTALTNALSERRIAQAYLFSGIRGVGKTTAARLLAKSLNCVEGPTATPCNVCTPCREITGGSDLDVIEVDAATYSKVEQVRELTESLRYGPARDRYKVVVLDEIHRLSRQAFDALLKIVEEPPPHLVFVFATTESEAVPATVLSRCQEFHFRRVSSDTLSRHLRTIAKAEDIEVSDPALHLISRAGEGSVRDSVALLDQLATFGAGTIADEDAARLVGGIDGGLLHGLLAAVLSGHSAEISEMVRRLEDEGRDPRQAYTQMLTFTRDALRLSLTGNRGGGAGGDEPRVDLPQEDARALAELAAGAGYENLLRLMQQLLSAESMVRRSDNGYLALEVAWLRAAELPKLTRVEDLLRGGPVTVPTGDTPLDPSDQEGGTTGGTDNPLNPVALGRFKGLIVEERTVPAEPEVEPAPEGASRPSKAAPTEEKSAEGISPPAVGLARSTAAFVDEVRRDKEALAAHLQAAELRFADGVLRIRHEPGDDWLTTRLARPANRRSVTAALERTWGPEASWRLEEGEARPDAGKAEAAPDPLVDEVAEHPKVQTVLELFGGTIDSVEEGDEQ